MIVRAGPVNLDDHGADRPRSCQQRDGDGYYRDALLGLCGRGLGMCGPEQIGLRAQHGERHQQQHHAAADAERRQAGAEQVQ